jgi:hypothetical protein
MGRAKRLVRIPAENLPCEVGRLVHVATDNNTAFVYRLLLVAGESAFLETPKTHRCRAVPKDDLCYTRKREPKRSPWMRPKIIRHKPPKDGGA